MTIAKATLTTNAWDTLYNHLQTGAYAISTDNIFSAWNSTLAEDKGYPLVIIEPPITSFNKLNVTGDLTESEIVFNIEVYHNNAANLKVLIDDINNKLLTGKRVLAGLGIKNMKIDAGAYDTWEEAGKKVHRSQYPISFRYIAK